MAWLTSGPAFDGPSVTQVATHRNDCQCHHVNQKRCQKVCRPGAVKANIIGE